MSRTRATAAPTLFLTRGVSTQRRSETTIWQRRDQPEAPHPPFLSVEYFGGNGSVAGRPPSKRKRVHPGMRRCPLDPFVVHRPGEIVSPVSGGQLGSCLTKT